MKQRLDELEMTVAKLENDFRVAESERAKLFRDLAIQNKQINELRRVVEANTTAASGVIQVFRDVQAAGRVAVGVQKAVMYLVKWGAILGGVAAAASVTWGTYKTKFLGWFVG